MLSPIVSKDDYALLLRTAEALRRGLSLTDQCHLLDMMSTALWDPHFDRTSIGDVLQTVLQNRIGKRELPKLPNIGSDHDGLAHATMISAPIDEHPLMETECGYFHQSLSSEDDLALFDAEYTHSARSMRA